MRRRNGVGESRHTRGRDYGFNWGPASIWRCIEYRGRRSLMIETDRRDLEVVASPRGDNLVVYLDGVRMVPER